MSATGGNAEVAAAVGGERDPGAVAEPVVDFDELLLGKASGCFVAVCRRFDLGGIPEDALGAEFEVRPTEGILVP